MPPYYKQKQSASRTLTGGSVRTDVISAQTNDITITNAGITPASALTPITIASLNIYLQNQFGTFS